MPPFLKNPGHTGTALICKNACPGQKKSPAKNGGKAILQRDKILFRDIPSTGKAIYRSTSETQVCMDRMSPAVIFCLPTETASSYSDETTTL